MRKEKNGIIFSTKQSSSSAKFIPHQINHFRLIVYRDNAWNDLSHSTSNRKYFPLAPPNPKKRRRFVSVSNFPQAINLDPVPVLGGKSKPSNATILANKSPTPTRRSTRRPFYRLSILFYFTKRASFFRFKPRRNLPGLEQTFFTPYAYSKLSPFFFFSCLAGTKTFISVCYGRNAANK